MRRKDISFCTCPGSSGDTLGSYHYDTKMIYIDGKAIAYNYDVKLEDKFIRTLSHVIQHEVIHKVLHGFISKTSSRKFDNINLLGEL